MPPKRGGKPGRAGRPAKLGKRKPSATSPVSPSSGSYSGSSSPSGSASGSTEQTEDERVSAFSPEPLTARESLTDLPGLASLKESVNISLILPHLFPGLFDPVSTVLLYGLPGTSKTFVVQSLVNELQGALQSIDPHTRVFLFNGSSDRLISQWRGVTEKNIRALFATANDYALSSRSSLSKSVVFLDEVDALASSRSKAYDKDSVTSTNALLQTMQGLVSYKRVIVLASTNFPWQLDPAILRRFQLRLYLDLPDPLARAYVIASIIDDRIVQAESEICKAAIHPTMVRGKAYTPLGTKCGYRVVQWLAMKDRLMSDTKPTRTHDLSEPLFAVAVFIWYVVHLTAFSPQLPFTLHNEIKRLSVEDWKRRYEDEGHVFSPLATSEFGYNYSDLAQLMRSVLNKFALKRVLGQIPGEWMTDRQPKDCVLYPQTPSERKCVKPKSEDMHILLSDFSLRDQSEQEKPKGRYGPPRESKESKEEKEGNVLRYIARQVSKDKKPSVDGVDVINMQKYRLGSPINDVAPPRTRMG